jgi:electron transfer flavoprotein beta subunit
LVNCEEKRELRIVVCVKQILDTELPLTFGQDNCVRQIGKEQLYVINPVDRCALEAAILIKQKFNQGIISVVTVGSAIAKQVLHYCLAQGADEAIHVLCDSYDILDSFQISFILSKVISELDYDLILCGNRSSDSTNSQVGPSLAELLNLPQVTDVINFEITSELKQAQVQRRLEKGKREIIECPLPAVFTVDKFINEPHYVSIYNYLLATQRTIVQKTTDSLGINSNTMKDTGMCLVTTNIALPRPRPKKTPAMDTKLSTAERQRMLTQGGLGETKKTEFLEGEPDVIAAKVIERLTNAGFITR